MSSSFLTSVRALVVLGGLAGPSCRRRDNSKQHLKKHLQISQAGCACQSLRSRKAVAKRSPKGRAEVRTGGCFPPAHQPTGNAGCHCQEGLASTGTGCRRRSSPCSRDTMGSELQLQSRSVSGGEEEHLENMWNKKRMGWPGLDQSIPSLCAPQPNLCVCVWVFTFIRYHCFVGLLQLAFHRGFPALRV